MLMDMDDNSDKRILKKAIDKQLGELLVEQGAIEADQLKMALEIQKEQEEKLLTGEILVQLGFASEEDIMEAFVSQYSVPYLPLSRYQVNPEVVSLVPVEIARENNLMPIDRIGNSITVAMSNPLNTGIVEELENLTNYYVQPLLSAPTDIKNCIDLYYHEKK